MELSVGIGVLIAVVIAIAARTEVRCIAEAYLRGYDVADSLDLVAEYLAVRNPESINLRACRDGEVPVVDVVETVYSVSNFRLCGFIP